MTASQVTPFLVWYPICSQVSGQLTTVQLGYVTQSHTNEYDNTVFMRYII